MSNLTLNDLVPGTLGILNDGKLAVITGVKLSRPTYPLVSKMKAGETAYKGRPEDFKVVLGKIDLAALDAAAPAKIPEFVPLSGIDDPFRPMNLRDVKVGDNIIVRHGSKEILAVYKGYNRRRPQYPLSYEINGKSWKGSVDSFVRKAA